MAVSILVTVLCPRKLTLFNYGFRSAYISVTEPYFHLAGQRIDVQFVVTTSMWRWRSDTKEFVQLPSRFHDGNVDNERTTHSPMFIAT